MFSTNITLARKYNYLNDKFLKAYEWLENNDINQIADGRYDICDGVFAMVQRYTTIPFSQAKFEAHNDYFDIQYIAKGKESFGIAMREDLECEEEQLENDVIFFKTPEFYTCVNLKEGDFICVPPTEAHQPRVAYKDQCQEVTKVVIKVLVK